MMFSGLFDLPWWGYALVALGLTHVTIAGVTVGSPSDLSDGLGIFVDDGSGQVRVIVGPAALGGARCLPRGE